MPFVPESSKRSQARYDYVFLSKLVPLELPGLAEQNHLWQVLTDSVSLMALVRHAGTGEEGGDILSYASPSERHFLSRILHPFVRNQCVKRGHLTGIESKFTCPTLRIAYEQVLEFLML